MGSYDYSLAGVKWVSMQHPGDVLPVKRCLNGPVSPQSKLAMQEISVGISQIGNEDAHASENFIDVYACVPSQVTARLGTET
jgi:hypothetical protein